MLKKKFWREVIIYFPLLRFGPHRKLKKENSHDPKKLSEYADRWTETEEYTDGYWQGALINILLFFFLE
jgi:hypothetical protein